MEHGHAFQRALFKMALYSSLHFCFTEKTAPDSDRSHNIHIRSQNLTFCLARFTSGSTFQLGFLVSSSRALSTGTAALQTDLRQWPI